MKRQNNYFIVFYFLETQNFMLVLEISKIKPINESY